MAGFACTPDDTYKSAKYEYAGIRVIGLPASIAEDNGKISIPVHYGGELTNSQSFTVSYTVTGGTYGTDYTIVGQSSANGTVSVGSGQTGTEAMGVIEIVPVADFATESNVPLTVTLNEASNGLSVGHPLRKSYSFIIQDDDCDYVADNFIGTGASVETYSDGSKYPTSGTYPTVFTTVGTDLLEMDNFWDSGMVVQLQLDPVTRTLTVVERNWSQYGFEWNITGTGTISTCAKALTVEFRLTSPDYGGGYDDTFKINYQF